MTPANTVTNDMGLSREEVYFSCSADVLAWRHALEISEDPDYERPGLRVAVYPKSLNKLGLVYSTCNMGIDGEACRWPAYEAILVQAASWAHRMILLPEDPEDVARFEELTGNVESWMRDAKTVAVANYRQALEDGPDVCDSESESENSDHGEQWSNAGMYTQEMLGPDGQPLEGRSRLTTEQANALRAKGKSGGPDTVRAPG
jgi:hypothetical protein